jgi:hypothetical protein
MHSVHLIGCKKLYFAYLWLFTKFWPRLMAAGAWTMGQKFGWHGSCAYPIACLFYWPPKVSKWIIIIIISSSSSSKQVNYYYYY